MLSITRSYGQITNSSRTTSAIQPRLATSNPDVFFSGHRSAQETANQLVQELASKLQETAPKDIDFHTSQRVYFPTPVPSQSCPSFEASFKLDETHYEIHVSQLGDIQLRKATEDKTEAIRYQSPFRKKNQTTFLQGDKAISIEMPAALEQTCRSVYKALQQVKRSR